MLYSSQQTCCQDVTGNYYLTGPGGMCIDFGLCAGASYDMAKNQCCEGTHQLVSVEDVCVTITEEPSHSGTVLWSIYLAL